MIRPLMNAIAGLMSRGTKSVFLTPNIRALVAKHVKDPMRADKLSGLFDEQEALVKAFQKEKQDKIKQFQQMQRNRNTERWELESLLHQDLADHQRLQNTLIKIRLRAQKLIEPDEWQEIVKDAAKKANQVYLDRQKVIATLAENRNKLDAKAEKVIRDRETLREFRSILKFYWRQLAEIQQSRNVIPPRHPVLSNHHATEADLRKAVEEVNLVRRTAYETFAASHAKLVEIIPEKEWKKIF